MTHAEQSPHEPYLIVRGNPEQLARVQECAANIGAVATYGMPPPEADDSLTHRQFFYELGKAGVTETATARTWNPLIESEYSEMPAHWRGVCDGQSISRQALGHALSQTFGFGNNMMLSTLQKPRNLGPRCLRHLIFLHRETTENLPKPQDEESIPLLGTGYAKPQAIARATQDYSALLGLAPYSHSEFETFLSSRAGTTPKTRIKLPQLLETLGDLGRVTAENLHPRLYLGAVQYAKALHLHKAI